ncbi:hypothetical protein BJX61DRAFT_546458 [Aspergillus egyptiacus]|nr:hypothetical protein BJX61DRAFT_546458 [Aspergillus egyptiacus]
MPSSSSSNHTCDGGPRKYAYNREGARERETHLYLPYLGFCRAEKSVGSRPTVSRDGVLTVFAQLAALRMHARRAVISLVDKASQYVVAEATPALRLRAPRGGEGSDELWLGVRKFPRKKIAMCYCAEKTFVEERRDIFVSADLAHDARFKDHPSVTGSPGNRFYVSVPIISPHDFVIGSVGVWDDSPRDEVSAEQKQFLQELSATVMDHLMSQRAMREECREEKMVRALGLFVKGKSDLNEWFNQAEAPDQRHSGPIDQVSQRLDDMQLSSDHDSNADTEEDDDADDKVMLDSGDDYREDVSPVQKYIKDDDEHRSDEEDTGNKKQQKKRPRLSPTTSQLQESLVPSNVRSVVNRAASMIYQALDVEGAMFIDASVYARRQAVGESVSKVDGPENYEIRKSGGMGEGGSQGNDRMTHDGEEATSIVLGHFTSSTASKGVDVQDNHYVPLSGGFISHLIDQYPRGRIFHLEDDGSISLSYEGLADDMDHPITGTRQATTTDQEQLDVEQETMDMKRLTKVLPDARCIAIYPVWNFQRGRWFTVCVVWSNDPGRVLSEPKDLTYLAAFSNTIMAEVCRLDLEAADRAKSDFISSLSHELRSPLHGLLGTVELLQEIVDSYAQRSLVETVYSCGRTLLDTLNHLLDYSRIRTLTQPPRSQNARGEIDPPDSPGPVSGSRQDEDLSVLVQEVVEGLLAGAGYQRRGPNRNGDAGKTQEVKVGSQLITVVDIEWKESWQFSVHAGAWRRVIMNLFGNALKYTQNGYVRLVMKPDTLLMDGHSVAAVRMTISDSGRGMSKDFLNNHLYSAFLQEDNTSPGLGVGLHLVHQIVKSLKGTIAFSSELARGTTVNVVLPIAPREDSPHHPSRSFGDLRYRLSGMTVALFGRSSEQGNLGFDTQIFDSILQSLGRMVSNWFGLRGLTSEEIDSVQPDFAIVTEHEYRNHYRDGTNIPRPDSRAIQPRYPLIVLSARSSSWEAIEESAEDLVIFLLQPVSPKTLATAFTHCLRAHQKSSAQTANQLLSSKPCRNGTPRNPEREQLSIKTNSESDDGNADEHAKKKVLLVDDNQVNLKIVEMCVNKAGCMSDSAQNGLQALERFKQSKYDAVVMDISMPVMDGLTATREMRKFERKSKMPPATIIILTAALSPASQREAMVSGVNLFLTKPTPLKRLQELLEKMAKGEKISRK